MIMYPAGRLNQYQGYIKHLVDRDDFIKCKKCSKEGYEVYHHKHDKNCKESQNAIRRG